MNSLHYFTYSLSIFVPIYVFSCIHYLQKCGQIHDSLNIKWIIGPDMPFGLSAHIQSVLVQGLLYVGGGRADYVHQECMVMAFHIQSRKWHELPPYIARRFAMAVVNDQLVVVGGCNQSYEDTNALGVWDSSKEQWTNPYPPMSTVRSDSSAVVYKQWLIVAGGMSHGYSVSTIEILDVAGKQWYSALPTPISWSSMKSVLVGDMWYLMGGYVEDGGNTDKVYAVSLSTLLSQANSNHNPHQIWKIISGLGLKISTPLNFCGSLLAVGGMNVHDNSNVSHIHHYRSESDKWFRVGDLPSALYNCTCNVTSDGDLLMAGGYSNSVVKDFVSISKYLYIGSLLV